MAPPRLVGDDRVLRLADVECGGVVGEHVLQEGQRVGAADHEAPHVRHVEQPRPAARGQVLADDAAGVLDRHLPAGEVDDLAAGRDVPFVERCALGSLMIPSSSSDGLPRTGSRSGSPGMP